MEGTHGNFYGSYALTAEFTPSGHIWREFPSMRMPYKIVVWEGQGIGALVKNYI